MKRYITIAGSPSVHDLKICWVMFYWIFRVWESPWSQILLITSIESNILYRFYLFSHLWSLSSYSNRFRELQTVWKVWHSWYQGCWTVSRGTRLQNWLRSMVGEWLLLSAKKQIIWSVCRTNRWLKWQFWLSKAQSSNRMNLEKSWISKNSIQDASRFMSKCCGGSLLVAMYNLLKNITELLQPPLYFDKG